MLRFFIKVKCKEVINRVVKHVLVASEDMCGGYIVYHTPRIQETLGVIGASLSYWIVFNQRQKDG